MFRENEFASITLESSVSLTGISQQVNHDMRKNNGRFVILSTEEGVYIQFSGVSDWERDFIMGVHYAVLVQGIQIPFGDCFDGLDWMTLWTGMESISNYFVQYARTKERTHGLELWGWPMMELLCTLSFDGGIKNYVFILNTASFLCA